MRLVEAWLRVSLILILVHSASDAVGAAKKKRSPNNLSTDCLAEKRLDEKSLTASGIRRWLKAYGRELETVDEFVCCLPESYLKNYVVGHSSIAAQPGIPVSPRVIMFNPSHAKAGEKKESLRFTAFSVNGGHESLAQSSNVEIMTLNEESQMLELYDLHFDKQTGPAISGANPETCMSCHGNGELKPVGGPRPIFDSFGRWNRFVGGRDPFCSQTEKEYFTQIDEIATDSVKKNSRFRCLNTAVLGRKELPVSHLGVLYQDQFRILTQLDIRLSNINRNRIVNVIRSYRDFPRIKHGLFGLYACGGSFQEWLPNDVAQRIREMGPLRKVYRQSNWREKASLAFDQLASVHLQKQEKMKTSLEAGRLNGEESIDPPSNHTVSCPQHLPDVKSRLVAAGDGQVIRANFRSELKITSAEDLDILNRFKVQTSMDGVNSDPALKYIFEALDEDTSFWQMAATGDGSLTEFQPLSSVLRVTLQKDETFRKNLLKFFDQKEAFADSRSEPLLLLNQGNLALMKRDGVDSCGEFKKWTLDQNSKSARQPNGKAK